MKKTWIAAAAAAVLLGGAVIGGAAFTGAQAKKRLQEAPRQWQSQWPMLKVVEQQYDRGLFSATHRVALQLGCDAGDGVLLTLQQRVRHGPLPGFTAVGAAVVDTEFVLPEASRKAAAALFGDKPPLTARTVVGLDGASRTQLAMPAFKFADPQGQQFEFQGLSAEVTERAGVIGYEMAMPSFVVRNDDGKLAMSMTLSGVRMRGEMRGDGSMWVRAGRGDGEIGLLQASVAPRGGQPVPALSLSLNDMKFSSENKVDKGLLDNVGQLSGRGTVNDVKLDKLELQASLKRVHVAGYEQLIRRMMDTSAAACGMKQAVSPEVFLAQLQQDVAALLPSNPEYSLDKLVVESGGRRGELSYAFGLEGATAEDAKLPLPALMMTKGRLRGHAKLPLPWIEQAVLRFGGAPGRPADAAAQAEMVNVMLAKLTADGLVVREGDLLSTQFSFQQGQMLVNGKPAGRPAPQ